MSAQPFLPITFEEVAAVRPRRVPVRAHLRSVGRVAPATGREQKDAALLAMEGRAAISGALAYVRAQLLDLYRSRVQRGPAFAFVTADDVETILEKWPRCPDEAKRGGGPQNWRGTIFGGGKWRKIAGPGVPSLRPHMRHTELAKWRPTQDTP